MHQRTVANICLNSFGDESLAEEGFALENQVFKEASTMWMLSSDPTQLSLVVSDCVEQLWGGVVSAPADSVGDHLLRHGFPSIVLSLSSWPFTYFTVSRPLEASSAVDRLNFPWVSLVLFPSLLLKSRCLLVVIKVLHWNYWCVLTNVFHHMQMQKVESRS